MAWIRYDVNMQNNMKVRRLARMLDVSVPAVAGHLMALWAWGVDNAPDGDVTHLMPEEIAEAANWTGDAQAFYDALINCVLRFGAFLDRTEDGRLVFHEWEDHIGTMMKERENHAERNRKYRERQKEKRETVTRQSRDASRDESRDGGEEREEKKEKRLSPLPPSHEGERQSAEDEDAATVTRVIKAWNDQLSGYGFPEASKATPRRERAFDARLNERRERKSLSWWQDVFRQMAGSKFLRDEASRKAGWLCFDWILKEDNLVKVCEGKYSTQQTASGGTMQDYNRIIREAKTYEEKRAAYYASLTGGRQSQ